MSRLQWTITSNFEGSDESEAHIVFTLHSSERAFQVANLLRADLEEHGTVGLVIDVQPVPVEYDEPYEEFWHGDDDPEEIVEVMNSIEFSVDVQLPADVQTGRGKREIHHYAGGHWGDSISYFKTKDTRGRRHRERQQIRRALLCGEYDVERDLRPAA